MALRRTWMCAAPLVLAAALAIAPTAEAAKRSPSCKRAKSKTVERNAFARVYEVRTADGSNLYGCRRSTGRRVLLDTAHDDDYVSSSTYARVRLAGRFVAWSWSSTDVSCKAACPPDYQATKTGISVYDLRRRLHRTIVGPAPLALVASRNGGVAWAARAADNRAVEIRASVRAGEERMLDAGAIDPRSLAIEITIVSWTRDGLERFARLR